MAELFEQLGLTRWEYERICDIQGREPTHVELAVFSLMWSEHCGYKHSKPLLKRFPTKADTCCRAQGERRHRGHRRRRGRGHEDREPQPSLGRGALPGRGHRSGRHHPRHLRHGARPICGLDSLRFGEIEPLPPRSARVSSQRRGAASASRAAAVRGGRRAGRRRRGARRHRRPKSPRIPVPPVTTTEDRQRVPVRAGGSRYRGDGNGMGIPTVAGEVYFEDPYAGNCLVNAMTVGLVSQRRHYPQQRCRRGQPRGALRFEDRAATASAGPACWPARCSTRPWKRCSRRSRWVILHREEAAGSLPGTAPRRPVGGAPGSGRGRHHLLVQPDGGQGRSGHRPARRPGALARSRHGALGDHDQREPGAHALHRGSRALGGREGRLRPLGPRRHHRGRGHRHGAPASLLGGKMVGDMDAGPWPSRLPTTSRKSVRHTR